MQYEQRCKLEIDGRMAEQVIELIYLGVSITSSGNLVKNVVVLSILILHYNMYYFHFTLQEPC